MSDGFFALSTFAGKPATPQAGLPLCGKCGLYKNCLSPKMKPAGAGKRKILFVGEAPGKTEDERNEYFTGESGFLLRELCADAEVNPDECSMVYAAACHPSGELDEAHVDSCRPAVLNAVAAAQPNVIILLGLGAVRSIIGPEWHGDVGAAVRWAGWRIPSERYGAWLCPTYSPAYAVRQNRDAVLLRHVRGHIRAAVALEYETPRKTTLAGLRSAVEVITNPRLARLRLKDLAKKSGVLTFDYETTGLKPERAEQRIVSASFCFQGKDTFACPVTDEVVGPLVKVLQNPALRKGASNLKFEERWSRTKLGTPVAGWHWDTMLAAHCHDHRRQVTSVKFQTYVHFGVGGYAEWVDDYFQSQEDERYGANGVNDIDKIHIDDLLTYNGVDSLVEYMVMERQMELMGLEGM